MINNKYENRTSSILALAQVEASRMRTEGFDIPRNHQKNIELREDMTRYELRKALARGNMYITHSGESIDGPVAVDIMESTYSKIREDKWGASYKIKKRKRDLERRRKNEEDKES